MKVKGDMKRAEVHVGGRKVIWYPREKKAICTCEEFKEKGSCLHTREIFKALEKGGSFIRRKLLYPPYKEGRWRR